MSSIRVGDRPTKRGPPISVRAHLLQESRGKSCLVGCRTERTYCHRCRARPVSVNALSADLCARTARPYTASGAGSIHSSVRPPVRCVGWRCSGPLQLAFGERAIDALGRASGRPAARGAGGGEGRARPTRTQGNLETSASGGERLESPTLWMTLAAEAALMPPLADRPRECSLVLPTASARFKPPREWRRLHDSFRWPVTTRDRVPCLSPRPSS